MKRCFIHALWGVQEHNGRRFYKRRAKHDEDIRLMLRSPYNPSFKVYTFGEDNHKAMEDLGFDSVLLDKRPIVWDMDTEQFRHKLEVMDKAMEDFDEIVFLDWDTIAVKEIPDNFWDKMYEKDSFQSPIIQYKRRKALWRGRSDTRKLSSASFVYIRDKSITEGFIKTWENIGRPWSEELAMTKYIDKIDGGWKGPQYYWDHHEPHWFALPRKYWSYTPQQYRNEKDRLFHHFDSNETAKIINRKIINWEKHLQ